MTKRLFHHAHDPVLQRLLARGKDVPSDLIRFTTFRVVNAVKIDFENSLAEPCEALPAFVKCVVRRGRVTVATLLVALVYIDRLSALAAGLAGGRSTRHRVFLISLVLASKYTQEFSLRNADWARCSSLFSLEEINLMERLAFESLDYDLKVTEEDVFREVGPYIKNCRLTSDEVPLLKPATLMSVREASLPPIALSFRDPFARHSSERRNDAHGVSHKCGSPSESPRGTRYVYDLDDTYFTCPPSPSRSWLRSLRWWWREPEA